MPKPGGYIYALGAEGTSFVKIGSTRTSVPLRLKQLQTGQPFPLQVLAAVSVETNMRGIEKQVHTFLAEAQRRGEWFEMPMDLATLKKLIVRALQHMAEAEARHLNAHEARSSHRQETTLFAQRLVRLREKQGMSQVALARALGASINAINMLEVGSTRAPHIDRLIAIADLFNVSLDYLVGQSDDPRPPRRRKPSSADTDKEEAA